jgi:uncharacterized membrane-anchored protein YjiN (DUF445 family)
MQAREDLKRARLWRLRVITTALLPAAVGVLIVAGRFKHVWPVLGWVQSFAEAALVGGLADWFAVVALFRHPMGVPFPHTAIVPRNKDRIGIELGRFVEQNFLTPANVAEKFAEQGLAARGLGWLADPENAAQVVHALGDAVPVLTREFAGTETGRSLGVLVAGQLERVPAAPLVATLLEALSSSREVKGAADFMLARVAGVMDHSRGYIKARFAERSRLTPFWVDQYLVNRFVDAIVDMAHEVAADADHPMRDLVETEMMRLAVRLREDEGLQQRLQDTQRDLLRSLDSQRLIREALSHAAAASPDSEAAALRQRQLAELVARFAEHVAADPGMVGWLDRRLRSVIEQALGLFEQQFSVLISDVVQKWDARTVSEKLELEVGSDLQFIRLNGMVVGGLAGLVLHPVLGWLGIN